MPDITQTQQAELGSTLDWVGMKGIYAPITIKDTSGQLLTDTAKLQVYVNIHDPKAKGIHMSRLYLQLEQFTGNLPIMAQHLSELLTRMLQTHVGISDSVQVLVSCSALLKRTALKSNNTGWKAYPLSIRAVKKDEIFTLELGIKIPYSSSCPCSAALSRQLLQQAFIDEFSHVQSIDKNTFSEWLLKNGSLAIPHSQRSYADIWLRLSPAVDALPIIALINACEQALKTPVQTAVKREDEQEFARLNGQHQQFCEDAARQLKATLNCQAMVQDFWLQVDHQESLHAHDAVAITTKGLKTGYQPHMFFALAQ